jgi:hypothetical protein
MLTIKDWCTKQLLEIYKLHEILNNLLGHYFIYSAAEELHLVKDATLQEQAQCQTSW